MDDRTAMLLLQALGIIFILMGIMGMTGIYKRWYWSGPTRAYGYVPFGILAILVSFEKPIKTFLGSNFWILIVLYALLLGLGLFVFAKPPKFIKPAWIRRIETEPKRVYQAMVEEVTAKQDWRKKVATQEALESWIKEIQKKQRLHK